MRTDLLLKEQSYAIRGAIFEVYKETGCGFAEAVYQECLEREFAIRGIPFVAQPSLAVSYKGQLLKSTFTPDLICFDLIIVELKAVSEIIEGHRVQIRNYLRSSNLQLGILANFGHYPGVEIERHVMDEGRIVRATGRSLPPPQTGI